MQAMVLGQGLLSFQLLQYHILMPSLLISKRSSECPQCPSQLENMRAAKLSNHLAINQLSHIIIGHLATHLIKIPDKVPFCQPNSTCSKANQVPTMISIDECAAGTDDCDVNADCTDTLESESFTCTCRTGFIGDGTTCTDEDECAAGTDDCDVNADCTNTHGSFTCACHIGFTGDGTTCTDIDECADETDDCDVNANCANTDGSFTCACHTGFTGDGTTCTVLPSNGPVALGQFPYVTSIQVTNFHGYNLHLCGGTLINSSWVLTAAHCLTSEKAEKLVVVSGVLEIGGPLVRESTTNVSAFFKHPEYVYHKKPYEHDVALIHLAKPVVESDFVKVATLPSTSFDNFKAQCQEPGWGAFRENEPGSNTMKVSSVPMLPNEICDWAYPNTLGENSICAGEDGEGSCVGDNGGPLVCNSKPVAIMSWREGCARPGKPAVYMDVSKYVPWILETMKQRS